MDKDMTKEEIKENNELIALFMGYKYQYLAEEDYSDCGGLYTVVKYYSNHPLGFEYWGKDGEPNSKAIFPNNTDFKYLAIEVSGSPSFVLDNELKYHRDWNQLMNVIDKIEELQTHHVQINYDINKYYLHNFDDGTTESGKHICHIWSATDFPTIKESVGDDKLLVVYNQVVKFIKEYNKHNNEKR